MDVIFVTPNSSAIAYQGLAVTFAAIEPPTWSLLLAESCRAQGFSVGILDCDAERLSLEASVKRISEARPRLILDHFPFRLTISGMRRYAAHSAGENSLGPLRTPAVRLRIELGASFRKTDFSLPIGCSIGLKSRL